MDVDKLTDLSGIDSLKEAANFVVNLHDTIKNDHFSEVVHDIVGWGIAFWFGVTHLFSSIKRVNEYRARKKVEQKITNMMHKLGESVKKEDLE